VSGELLITGLAEVATPRGSRALAGPEQGAVRRIAEGEILVRDGRIAFVGPRAERVARFGELAETPRLPGGGGTAVPGFVDAHTHLPWAGSREEEFLARLAGRSYQEIAAAGGGILSTVAATRRAPREEIVGAMLRRMDWMLSCGTTTAEAKSGYGLNLPDELKQLEAIREAAAHHPIDLHPTLLAAHETPLSTAPTGDVGSTGSARRSSPKSPPAAWRASATFSASAASSAPTNRAVCSKPGPARACALVCTPTSSPIPEGLPSPLSSERCRPIT
jgi:imidazolonepropionase-like amidohydrolase